jgi:hypothetical protein
VFVSLSLIHIIEPGYKLEDSSHDMRQLGFLQLLSSIRRCILPKADASASNVSRICVEVTSPYQKRMVPEHSLYGKHWPRCGPYTEGRLDQLEPGSIFFVF